MVVVVVGQRPEALALLEWRQAILEEVGQVSLAVEVSRDPMGLVQELANLLVAAQADLELTEEY